MRAWPLLVAAAMMLFSQRAHAQVGLHARLSHFAVSAKPLPEALRQLALEVRNHAVIGFEYLVVPNPAPVDITIDNGTLKDALEAMCAPSHYTYTEASPGIIEVTPEFEPSSVREMMNISVPKFDLNVVDWPNNLFARAAERIPEVREYLAAKVLDWSRKTGNPPPGSPGSIFGGGNPPRIEIHRRDTTVRGVLDAFARYTVEHASADSNVNLRYYPSGWRVDFTPDPQAPTGLDGYLKWSRFP